jgi:ABC-2 type transport system ATP-binding protein
VLTVRGISKHFGEQAVLRDVSFSVHRHEVLGLIGPNGAGKTTLLECMAGLLEMDGGAMTPARRDELFYLPDAIRPWKDQRVRSVVRFFEDLYGQAHGTGVTFAETLQVGYVMPSRMRSLSKGELKRVLLVLGLLTPHRLLLLDEPFDGLDFRQTREVMELLRTLPARGRTLFLSIHQLTDAARVCDRFILLSRGQVVGEGTLADLQQRAGCPDASLEEIFLALT